MDNPRPEKVAVVDEVKDRLAGTDAAVLTEYRGLNVTALADLRIALRNAGGDYKIYKNTLVRFAARALELELEDLLTGPTAIAFVAQKPDGQPGDAVEVAKALKDFAKTHPALVLKGGVLGTRSLTASEAEALAETAPREELLSRLAGGLAAPMRNFASLLQALPRDFAYGLQALIDKQGGVPAADATPAPAEEAAPDAPAAESVPAEAEAEATTEPAAEAPADAAPETSEPETTEEAAEAPAEANDTETES